MPQMKRSEKVRATSFKIADISAAYQTKHAEAIALTSSLDSSIKAIKRIASLVDNVQCQKAAVHALAERLAHLEQSLAQLPGLLRVDVDTGLGQAIQRALSVVQRCQECSSTGVLYKVLHKTTLMNELAAANEELYRSAREASSLSAHSALTQQQPQCQLTADSAAPAQGQPQSQLSADCSEAIQNFAAPLPVCGEGESGGDEEEKCRLNQLESSVTLWSYKWGLLDQSQVVEQLCNDKLVTLKELQDLKADLEAERKRWEPATKEAPLATTKSFQVGKDVASLLVQTERAIAQLEGEEQQRDLAERGRESAEVALKEGRSGDVALMEHRSAELEGEGQPRTVIVPASFLCPITQELMWDPVVVVASNQTYERRNIVKWLSDGKRRDFVTGQIVPALSNPDLFLPNECLRHTIGVMLAPQEPFCRLPREEWQKANVRFEYEFGGESRGTPEVEELTVVPVKSGNLLRRVAMGDHTPLSSNLKEATSRWWGSGSTKPLRSGGRFRSSSVPRMPSRSGLESAAWLATTDNSRPRHASAECPSWLEANDNGNALVRRSGTLALGRAGNGNCVRSVHGAGGESGTGSAAWLRRKVRARFLQGSGGLRGETGCDKLSAVHHSAFSDTSAWLQRKISMRKSGPLLF